MKDKNTLTFIILLFIIVNVVFNFRSWQEIASPAKNEVSVGDSTLAEFILENNYRNIIRLENPFIVKKKLFYPYEVNLSLNDPGTSNVIFFFFLRPFFDIHKSMLIVVLLNTFFANICMYILLIKMKIKQHMAAIIALSYGFTPIAAYRLLGHYTYTSIYLYPLIFLLILLFLEAKTKNKRYYLSFFIGLLFALTLLLNFYYFITMVIALFIYLGYFVCRFRKELVNFFKGNLKFILFSLSVFFAALVPWLSAVLKFVRFEGSVKTKGFAGAIELSGDLIGFFTPSEYNPLYRFIVLNLSSTSGIFAKYAKFYLNNWERFIYPGIFILAAYFYIFFFKQKIPTILWRKIRSYFIVSLIFFVLTLGPFLKIANRWSLPLEDGISLIFPLPFLLLHYIPGLSGLRASTRFLPIAIFFGLLVVAYLFNHFIKKAKSNKKSPIIVFLFCLFLVDQFYILPKRETAYFPKKAYSYISSEKNNNTVFEIPFTVRDGFNYIGFVHGISPMNGSFYHNKPVIGGYFARVNPSIFRYYSEAPFIGYVAKVIDKGNYRPLKDKPKEIILLPFIVDKDKVTNELDFLDIGYVLLKNNEKYSEPIKKILTDVGFIKKINDGEYDLYTRNVQKRDFEKVSFGTDNDHLYVAQGFSHRENGFRWTEGKIAKVFVKTFNTKKQKIIFNARSFYKSQNVIVYLNNKKLTTLLISTEKKQYEVKINENLISGINTIQFASSITHRPSEVLLNEKDTRDLALKLFSLRLE